MKYSFIPLLVTCLSFSSEVLGECRTRVEVRDLTQKQLQDYIRAVKKVQQTKDASGSSYLDILAERHDIGFVTIHSAPYFFPWHRKLLYNMENELRNFSPNITIPYWDWTYDAAKPAESIVLSNTWFGPAEENKKCFQTGQFQDYKLKYPKEHCLHRSFRKDAFFSQEEVQELIKYATTHAELYNSINAGPHGIPHNTIGGDMVTGYSPNDPLFFLHHSFIDKLWFDWQNKGGGNDYQWSKNDRLPVFNDKVGDWIDPNAPSNCIKYAPPKAIRGIASSSPVKVMENARQNKLDQVDSGTESFTTLALPEPFIYSQRKFPQNPLQDVSDHFLMMHNTTRSDFMKMKSFIDNRRATTIIL